MRFRSGLRPCFIPAPRSLCCPSQVVVNELPTSCLRSSGESAPPVRLVPYNLCFVPDTRTVESELWKNGSPHENNRYCPGGHARFVNCSGRKAAIRINRSSLVAGCAAFKNPKLSGVCEPQMRPLRPNCFRPPSGRSFVILNPPWALILPDLGSIGLLFPAASNGTRVKGRHLLRRLPN